jgi:Zn finger protein HypA/HybF involved in hydrogenase expression
MKRAIEFPPQLVCLGCEKKVVASFAKNGLCPNCNGAQQGLKLDISVKRVR